MVVGGHGVGERMGAGHAARWREQLGQWAIPQRLLDAASGDPHTFSVARFVDLADRALRSAPSPTHRRADEALPDGGSVLDVGCGGGAGSLPLAGRAGLLIGADADRRMLDAFEGGAQRLGVPVRTVEGQWPETADQAPAADVVVCLHVVYNVPALDVFARALTTHARRRVVVELPTHHPLAWLTPYWQAVHALDRPQGPTAADALAVFADLGVTVGHERWQRAVSLHDDDRDAQVAFICERLAVGADRRGQVAELVDTIGIPAERTVVTAWWDV